MQIHGDGPIKLLVVECDHQLQLRAMAKLAENAIIADDTPLSELININGKGRFVITLDPSKKMSGYKPHQGIVPIEGDTIAAVIENYMKQSEQLDTKLWLACNHQVSRGLLLQRLPHSGGTVQIKEGDNNKESADETWVRATLLGSTLKQEELINTSIDILLHRLFWEETVRVFEPQNVSFFCSCSREKVADMLKMLGKEEVIEAVTSLGKLDINCDFCGKPYSFDAVDCTALFFGAEIKISPSSRNMH